MEELQREKKPGPQQRTLDLVVKDNISLSFMHENILHVVMQFIAVDDHIRKSKVCRYNQTEFVSSKQADIKI